jgi:hypothetical protein
MNTQLLLPLALGCPSAACGRIATTGAGFTGQAADNFVAVLVANLNRIDGLLALEAPASDQGALRAIFDRAEVFVGRQV